MHFDIQTLIETSGYIGIFLIVFAESGLLIGFFLPGDSLLFTAGFLASQGFLNIYTLIFLVCLAAIGGDSAGYSIGRRFGRRIFNRPNARVFNAEHLKSSEAFYAKHGGKTLIIARFVPIVRTFAPVLAGVSKMPYRNFIAYNVFGGLTWGISVPVLGYWLGRSIPNIDRYLLPITGLIILLSISPSIIHLIRHPKELQKLKASLKRIITGK